LPWFLAQHATTAIERAETAIRHHEARYRTPLERIAGWRYNPTVRPLHSVESSVLRASRCPCLILARWRQAQVYRHTYLWPAKTLYYFWRDHDKAMMEKRVVKSPCYMNIINPVDVGLGEGPLYNLTQAIRYGSCPSLHLHHVAR